MDDDSDRAKLHVQSAYILTLEDKMDKLLFVRAWGYHWNNLQRIIPDIFPSHRRLFPYYKQHKRGVLYWFIGHAVLEGMNRVGVVLAPKPQNSVREMGSPEVGDDGADKRVRVYSGVEYIVEAENHASEVSWWDDVAVFSVEPVARAKLQLEHSAVSAWLIHDMARRKRRNSKESLLLFGHAYRSSQTECALFVLGEKVSRRHAVVAHWVPTYWAIHNGVHTEPVKGPAGLDILAKTLASNDVSAWENDSVFGTQELLLLHLLDSLAVTTDQERVHADCTVHMQRFPLCATFPECC